MICRRGQHVVVTIHSFDDTSESSTNVRSPMDWILVATLDLRLVSGPAAQNGFRNVVAMSPNGSGLVFIDTMTKMTRCRDGAAKSMKQTNQGLVGR